MGYGDGYPSMRRGVSLRMRMDELEESDEEYLGRGRDWQNSEYAIEAEIADIEAERAAREFEEEFGPDAGEIPDHDLDFLTAGDDVPVPEWFSFGRSESARAAGPSGCDKSLAGLELASDGHSAPQVDRSGSGSLCDKSLSGLELQESGGDELSYGW